MNSKRYQAAHILIRTTWLDRHPALQSSDCELHFIDWDTIGNHEWLFNEQVLLEVLRFVTTNQSNLQIDDLLTLTQLEQHAVLTALNQALAGFALEENLAHD